ncbi:hypothetical protein [Mucilaginibacter sp. 21P]|uniref:hypothetical protein n=1 Tax=Mucilaginibacter sp. 21P TaxID=2778902 RepID=UPI001C568EE6|nr:hypothetical protein [Mucilaginibacter sp. 21P]
MEVTFFFSAKKKVTKEKTRCYGNALQSFFFSNTCAIRTLHYAAFFGYVLFLLFLLFYLSAIKLPAKRAEQWWPCAAAKA